MPVIPNSDVYMKFQLGAGFFPTDRPIEGIYARPLGDGTAATWKPSAVPCPYCHGPLGQLEQRAFRILRVLEQVDDIAHKTIVSYVPPTHHLLACQACRQMFTTPIEASR